MAQQPDMNDVLGVILYDAIRLNNNHATITQLVDTINDDLLPYGKAQGPVDLPQVRSALRNWQHLYPSHQPRRYTTDQNTRSTLLERVIARQALQHAPEPLLTKDLIALMTVLHPTMPKVGAAQLMENLRHDTQLQYHPRQRRIGLANQPLGTRETRIHWWLIDSLNHQPNQTLEHLVREMNTRAGRAQQNPKPSSEEVLEILENNPQTFTETNDNWRTIWMKPTPKAHRLTAVPTTDNEQEYSVHQIN